MRNFNRGGYGGGRSFGNKRSFGHDRPRPQMYDAVCANCGKACQVPFKPTGEKPVYCRDCFAKMNPEAQRHDRPSFDRTSRPQGVTQEDLAALNEKLDKILALLEKPSEN